MREVLKKFGRYFLLDQIAQGGMAEIYRARLASREGAGRLLVIKRVQAGFGNNAEFLEMFRSEIKVMMGLQHPNIAGLFDFGSEESLPYIAMEFVDGKNVRQVLSRFNEVRKPFPVEIAAYVIEQAAGALHYAHAFRDKITGEPLNIIHRDISPQNILISYDGSVKVIDFGIAKADVNRELTRAGVIKGKPSYLSPEQISGDSLDGRCDIFALGTVLWELLTGKKLFAGDNDLAVLKLIESVQSHAKPPSILNPKVPPELDHIVLKSLKKDPAQRFQTAGEMQRALHKWLNAFSPDFDATTLAGVAKDLFKDEIVEDRKRIQRLNDKVEQLLFSESDGPSVEGLVSEGVRKEETTTSLEPVQKSTGAREAFNQSTINNKAVEVDLSRMVRSGSAPRPTLESSAPIQQQRGTRPSGMIQRNDKQASGSSGGRVALLASVAVVVAIFVGPSIGLNIPGMDSINSLFGLGGKVATRDARLVLQGNYPGVTVEVDGQEVARSLPATLSGIPAGRPIRVLVKGEEGIFQQELTLAKGEKRVVEVALGPTRGTASPQVVLRLSIASTDGNLVGSDLNINVSGREMTAGSPISKVPLDAPLTLVIESARYRRLERQFKVSASDIVNGEVVMPVELEPFKFGRLTIRTQPSAAKATIIDSEGKRIERETPFEAIEFPIGTYEIRLKSLVYDEKVLKDVKIDEGKLTTRIEQLEIGN